MKLRSQNLNSRFYVPPERVSIAVGLPLSFFFFLRFRSLWWVGLEQRFMPPIAI